MFKCTACSFDRTPSRHVPDYVHIQVYVAAAAVIAEQTFEQSLLAKAIAAARTPLLDYMPTMWTLTRQTLRDGFDAQQMRNATCLCAGAALAGLEGTAGFVSEADHQSGGNCTGALWRMPVLAAGAACVRLCAGPRAGLSLYS